MRAIGEESQEKDFMSINKSLFYPLLLVILLGCGREKHVILPDVFVDIRLNLTTQEALPLRYDGRAIYLEGGVKGIIVYRKNQDTYFAFERNCTFEPTKECARVDIDPSMFFMIDSCCGSQFDFEGNILGGPAPVPLKRYQTILSGNVLQIYN